MLYIEQLWESFCGFCKFLACFAVMLSPFVGIALIETSSDSGLHAGATAKEVCNSETDWPDALSGACK